MDDISTAADFFLKDIPNVKISKPVAPTVNGPPTRKEQLQLLHISETSQQKIMEALKHIHGPEFSLSDVSSYIDKGNQFKNRKFWMERGNLVIKGIVDYSKVKSEPEDEKERYNMFAVMRLESYYFHENHCIEALEYCTGEIEDALELLYYKYLRIECKSNEFRQQFSESDLLEQRTDEKSVLESMFDKAFNEKIKNSVWIISLKLDFLINMLLPRRNSRKASELKDNRKKKDMCRGFLRGHCKFGQHCRFSHEVEVKPQAPTDNFIFELEIRFPNGNVYPYEPPLIFLKTNAPLKDQICLHICKRLYKEALSFAQDGFPCIYSILDLLQNEDEITSYIKENKVNFLLPNEKLFPEVADASSNVMKPSHYEKGITNRHSKQSLTIENMLRDNESIIKKFRSKMNEAKYQTLLKTRKSLPAYEFKDAIIEKIKCNQVVIISGETGCGKSTQVPQYILDDWMNNYQKENLNIVCTQPRRISAIGVAERVAEERLENVGNTIGYQIRLENKISSSTRLTFCTTGILLRRMESDSTLNTVSHIIVDEVHERSSESDFLLVIIRNLLKMRKDLKVILMSATLNAELFADYFGDVPVFTIPGRTFPVQQYFLEEIMEECGFIVEENSQFCKRFFNNDKLSGELDLITSIPEPPRDAIRDEELNLKHLFGRYSDFSKLVIKNLYVMDPDVVNLELIEAVLEWIISDNHNYPKQGSILIFLPGISEITSLYDQLNQHAEFGKRLGKYLILPLHSSLSSDEQSAIFKPTKKGVRKIILSTNLAETSITIDDCVFVIDSGKMKEKRFDSNRNMESLDTVWVTRANALQRKGRAGRVMPGVCIHLFTNHRFKHHLLSQPIPEMHRISLEQLVLHIKVLPNFADQNVHEVLGNTLEPPVAENIDTALKRLQDVGALDKELSLTPLGLHLANLPVDVRIGKLMLYGSIFSCVDEALTIAACLSYKSPFVAPFKQKDAANEKKKKFYVGFSDHITILQAYKKWLQEKKMSFKAGMNFANENYLSVKTLTTLADIKHQLLELLVDIGFVSANLKKRIPSGQDYVMSVTGAEFNQNSEKPRLLSAILCAALYPNIVKILTPEKSYLISAAGAIPKETEAKNLRLRTKNEQVFLHPSSINYKTGTFPSPYLVYQEKVKTSKVFIRDCTMIYPVPLILFSGNDLEINVHNGVTYISLEDGWILFQVSDHKVAEMMKMMRIELQNLLEEKIKDPLLNLMHHHKGEKIIKTFLNLVLD